MAKAKKDTDSVVGRYELSPSDNSSDSTFNTDYKAVSFIELNKEYKCPICGYVLHSPVQTMCGHRYGKDCLVELLGVNNGSLKCSVGKDECDVITSEDIYPDYSVQRELKRLPVFCSYKPFGCDIETRWGELFDHEITCDFRVHTNGCSYFVYGCMFRGNDEMMDKHLNEKLPYHVECIWNYLSDYSLLLSTMRVDLERMKTKQPDFQHQINSCSSSLKGIQSQITSLERMLPRITSMSNNVEQKTKTLNISSGRFGSSSYVEKLEEEIRNLQARMQTCEERVESLRRGTLPQNQRSQASTMSSEVTGEVEKINRGLKSHMASFTMWSNKLLELEITSYDGHIIWKIDQYQNRLQQAKHDSSLFLLSQEFKTSKYGYLLQGKVYLNGNASGEGNHLSFYIVIKRSNYDALSIWPFTQRVTFTLLSQKARGKYVTKTLTPDPAEARCFKRPDTAENMEAGFPTFVTHSILEESDYIKDDTIFLKIQVDTGNLPVM